MAGSRRQRQPSDRGRKAPAAEDKGSPPVGEQMAGDSRRRQPTDEVSK